MRPSRAAMSLHHCRAARSREGGGGGFMLICFAIIAARDWSSTLEKGSQDLMSCGRRRGERRSPDGRGRPSPHKHLFHTKHLSLPGSSSHRILYWSWNFATGLKPGGRPWVAKEKSSGCFSRM